MGGLVRFQIITVMLLGLTLAGCGGGGGGGSGSSSGGDVCPDILPPPPAPQLPKLSSPVKVQVNVTVTDSGKSGATLHYRWKSSDGAIEDVDNPVTNWTLPDGPGLHFAYVLVSNGYGGYTQRRLSVNTDNFGISVPSSTTPRDYTAPAGGVQAGNYYSGATAGAFISEAGESDIDTYAPDALVYLVNNVTGKNVPANQDGSPNPVKTDIRGQYLIPGVPAQDPDPNAGLYATAYDIQCSVDQGMTWRACGEIGKMPNRALNNRDDSNTVAYHTISGRFRLADKSTCGTVNEFFGVEPVAVSAQLLDQNRQVLSGSSPVRLSDSGDFVFPPNASAAFVEINCEKNTPVVIPVGDNDGTQYIKLGTFLLANVHAPVIDTMTATIQTVEVGQFLPPPSGGPADLFPDKNKFLSYQGLDTRKGACQYYKAIGAVQGCDANGNFINPINFDDWQRATRMGKYKLPAATEYTANYINKVDLNLARNHHSISYGAAGVAAYVCNHAGPTDESQAAANSAISNAIQGKNQVACVAMDHSVSPGVNGEQPFTRFLIFGPSGELLPSVNLDGRSEKFVPGTCVVCHGGDKYARSYPEDGSGYADIGAHFLPYDVGNFSFSCQSGLTRAAQEEAIFHLNQNVLDTQPTKAAIDLIAGWYADGTHILNQSYTPSSWEDNQLPPEKRGLGYQSAYHSLVAHSCRTCHVNLADEHNFDIYTNFDKFIESTVGGDATFEFRSASMPNSLVTFNRFWNSPEQLTAYAKLKTRRNKPETIQIPVGEVAAGSSHTVFIHSDGTLWAMGKNTSGQLGNNTKTDSAVPVQIGSDNQWTNVYAGGRHSLAFKSDRTLWAWGDNSLGQLGDGSATDQLIPVKVELPVLNPSDPYATWLDVAAGDSHSLALLSSQGKYTLWSWGSNSNGQLGLNDNAVASEPVPKQIGSDTDWIRITAGDFHSMGIRRLNFNTNPTLYSWGKNAYGQLGLGAGVIADQYQPVPVMTDPNLSTISAGANHCLASTYSNANGIVNDSYYAWGDNRSGQLGLGNTSTVSSPTLITALDPISLYGATVVAGGNQSFAYSTDTVAAWGDNSVGQLGEGTTTNQFAPKLLNVSGTTTTPDNIISLATGADHTVEWDSVGRLWAWGDNTYGQLGDRTTVSHLLPTRVFTPPILKAYTPTTTVKAGINYQYNFSAFDVDGHVLTYSADLPGWLTFTTDSGLVNTAKISGLATADLIGTPQIVTVNVSDGIVTTRYAYTINVVP